MGRKRQAPGRLQQHQHSSVHRSHVGMHPRLQPASYLQRLTDTVLMMEAPSFMWGATALTMNT